MNFCTSRHELDKVCFEYELAENQMKMDKKSKKDAMKVTIFRFFDRNISKADD